MKRVFGLSLAVAFAIAAVAMPAAASEQTRIDADVNSWNVGSGQSNGEFVTGERYGVQVGIRAQQRYVGPLDVTADKQVGVYQAQTGLSSAAPDRAWWNYDFSADLRDAQGVAKGTTMDDYTFVLTTDIGFCPNGCDLATLPNFTGQKLAQESWNPEFFISTFDSFAEDTYHFTLTLTPKTFNGPPITVKMRVEVSNP